MPPTVKVEPIEKIDPYFTALSITVIVYPSGVVSSLNAHFLRLTNISGAIWSYLAHLIPCSWSLQK